MISRILWRVQDGAESNFLRSSNSVLRISPNTCLRVPEMDENSPYTYASMLKKINLIENRKKDIGLYKCWGKVGSRDEFITLFDSVNNFTCKIDEFKGVSVILGVLSPLTLLFIVGGVLFSFKGAWGDGVG